MKMTEIKTDIGFARAFVRLALERKLLHKHLKTVLQSSTLLQYVEYGYGLRRIAEFSGRSTSATLSYDARKNESNSCATFCH